MFLNVMWLWARIPESHWQDKTNQTVQLWRWQGTGVVWRSNETGLPGIEKHVTVTIKWPDSNCTLQFQEKHVLKKTKQSFTNPDQKTCKAWFDVS